MLIQINDRASYQITSREYTPEGFLRVPGHVARPGIQQYLARELGLDGDPNRIIKVYRPPEEVFNAKSLASYKAVDITDEHPAGLVTADNYRVVSKGVVTDGGVQDGDFVRCDLIVKDKTAIQAIESGKCELSAGYTAKYDFTPGVTSDGEAYDAVQRDIRINHVAIVPRARAGRQARVFDHKTGGTSMPVMITIDSGRSIDVADAANATVVADYIDRLKVTADSASALQATVDSLNEKVTQLTTQTSDSAIKQRVAAAAQAVAWGKRVAGETFTSDSVDPVEIKRAAMAVKRPKVDWESKDAAYVLAAAEILDADMEEEEEETKDAGGNGKVRVPKNVTTDAMVQQLFQLAQDAATVTQTNDADKPVVSRAQAALNKRMGKGE
ncbi:MAG: DUF2213 domain-containing protein [Plesiomonas shigelloides]